MGGQPAGSVRQERDSFGTVLRALREGAALTQEELAERAHLTNHAISALERGTRTRPYPHTVRALADGLGVSEEQRARLLAAVPRRSAGHAVSAAVPAALASWGLPAPATPLVGREQDIRQLAGLVRRTETRLITLTGTGGVGKTRLSIAVAQALEEAFPDGVVFVALASLSAADLVVPTIGRHLGLAAVDRPDVDGLVIDHLRGQRLLLVLDNFEHLLDAAPRVARLLSSCPELTVLVSSRAPLRVLGETEYTVHPLGLPSTELPDPEMVAASPAASVFLQRARAVAPGFTVTAGNAAAVAAICGHLAGIPLALELAAARMRFLDPQDLLARLGEAMERGGARDLPERQRTMRSTLDWSHRLLGDPEQRLFRRLAVFSGGFGLEAALAVAPSTEQTGGLEVLGLLEVLVEQSLVIATTGDAGRVRYGMLEPIRQYGRGLLAGSDDEQPARQAHAAYFLGLAEQAAPEYQRADQVQWLQCVELEHANMVAAFEWALANKVGETAGRLGWALWLYWWLRGHLLLGRRLMQAALNLPLPDPVRTRALLAAGTMMFAQGDLEASGETWRQALDRAEAAGDREARAHGLACGGLVALARGDLASADQYFRQAIPVAESLGARGDWLESLTHVWLGTVRMAGGDPVGALPDIGRGLARARQRGDRLAIYVALYNLSQAAIASGDYALARQHLDEGISLSQETGDLANLAFFLDSLAVAEGSVGAPERVATLLGAAQALRETVGSSVYAYYLPDEALRERTAVAARAALGDDAYEDAVDRGRSRAPDEAVAYAVAHPRDSS